MSEVHSGDGHIKKPTVSRRRLLQMATHLPEVAAVHTIARGAGPEPIEYSDAEKLAQWEAKISLKKSEFWGKIVESGVQPIDLVGKNLRVEEFKEKYDTYFPMYYAAQEKFGIRWEVLCVIHAQETLFSKGNYDRFDPYNPCGPMQIHGAFFSEAWRKHALSGYEFLQEIPTHNKTDAREILAAGKYLLTQWGDQSRVGDWDIEAIHTYRSINDADRIGWARTLTGITGNKGHRA